MTKLKKFLMISVVAISLAFLFEIETVFANDKYSTPTDSVFTDTYGEYKNETVYYYIDYIDLAELEDEGFFDKFRIFQNMKEGAIALAYNLMHSMFVEFPFFLLKTFASLLIGLFNKIYEVNFVNAIVDHMTSYIRSIAGISGNTFGTRGLFGGFLGIITISVALYTLYQFLVKRASISAFSGLLKSILALTMALVFFTNYSTIVKGLNTLSVEASGFILAGGANLNPSGNITNNTIKDQMNTALWNMFVHKPYLMLQYGTMDEQQIGRDRIRELLSLPKDSEERYELVKEEIENGNEMMTRGKMIERFTIIIIAFLANMVNSIPISLLAFALLFLQFWFTGMAMIAPFVFIWSAFPNQFGVLTRYFLELATPLVLKMGVSILALIIFSITNVLSSVAMTSFNDNSLLGFAFIMLAEGILLFTLILLRKRILNIFSMGSKELGYLRQQMSSTFTQPFKKGAQVAGTAVGAGVGASIAGIQGALVGANIGANVSKGLTGDQGLVDTTKNVALTVLANERLNALNSINAKGADDVENYTVNNDTPMDGADDNGWVESSDVQPGEVPVDSGAEVGSDPHGGQQLERLEQGIEENNETMPVEQKDLEGNQKDQPQLDSLAQNIEQKNKEGQEVGTDQEENRPELESLENMNEQAVAGVTGNGKDVIGTVEPKGHVGNDDEMKSSHPEFEDMKNFQKQNKIHTTSDTTKTGTKSSALDETLNQTSPSVNSNTPVIDNDDYDRKFELNDVIYEEGENENQESESIN